MTINAVFLHEEGYKYNLVYTSKKRFLNSLNKLRNAVFLDAVDYEQQIVVRPSNLPEYRALGANR